MTNVQERVEREIIASIELSAKVNAHVLRLRTLRGEVRARRVAAKREGRARDEGDCREADVRLTEAIRMLEKAGQGLAN